MHLNDSGFTRKQLASTKFLLEVISGYANSRFILSMFPIDINAKFDTNLTFLEKSYVPNNSDNFSKGHKITSKFCCAIQKNMCSNELN